MKALWLSLCLAILLASCSKKQETITPLLTSITESVYASGFIKSENQYVVFPTVNGTISKVLVEEGDTVTTGTPLLVIANETQRYSKDNAALLERLNDEKENEDKKTESQLTVDLAKSKMAFDSGLYFRQKALWEQQIGTKLELEQKEIAYKNAKSNYLSAVIRNKDLLKQLAFNSSQSKNNLKISDKLESEYTIKSEIDGTVYSINKSRGEWAGLQTPLATIGNSRKFILEMRIDEYDIFKIKPGQEVIVTMDSYKGNVFLAKVSKINPLMNEKTKSFTIEATFINPPEKLFPNITFEANIIIQKKDKTLIVPNRFFLNDTTVVLSNGRKVNVVKGLRDYKNTEVVKGLTLNDELTIPSE